MPGEAKPDVGFPRVNEVCSRTCKVLVPQLRRQPADGVSVIFEWPMVGKLTINIHNSGRFAVCKTTCNVQYADSASKECIAASIGVCRHDLLLCCPCALVSLDFLLHVCSPRFISAVAEI
jgi:hypothetical protein